MLCLSGLVRISLAMDPILPISRGTRTIRLSLGTDLIHFTEHTPFLSAIRTRLGLLSGEEGEGRNESDLKIDELTGLECKD
jgi:hypothetical protein